MRLWALIIAVFMLFFFIIFSQKIKEESKCNKEDKNYGKNKA